ncbi:gamma-secretase subunit APH-1A isoform X2 [Manis javanica]|uniref:gamma-secretase subunit APH-1A isoform X2 n=1 Tax=Manis javanica TaxID=9974 RepID=UPI00081391EB|nr:gamma-secretase subunit APH-1A isoform X2 [Manis javanica]
MQPCPADSPLACWGWGLDGRWPWDCGRVVPSSASVEEVARTCIWGFGDSPGPAQPPFWGPGVTLRRAPHGVASPPHGLPSWPLVRTPIRSSWPGLHPAPSCPAMGAAVFFGCTFVAFGPAFALFLITVAGDPLRVIILVAGAFFWLVSLLLASVVWFILVHVTDPSDARLQYGLLIFGAAVSVLLQEVFRFAYYKLLKKADEGLASLSEDGRSPISIRQMAYVSGLSFGIISGVFSVINILADALGPGVVGIHGDSPYYFLTSAFLTAAIILLHTFWGVVFFDACERRRYWALGLVVGSHLLTSGLTFLNPWYEASLLPIYAVTVSMGLWAFITAGGSLQSIQRSLLCRRQEDSRVMVYSALLIPPED